MDQASFEDFVENSIVPMHLVSAEGVILHANNAELELLGYAREEYCGRHIAEFHQDGAKIDDILARLSRNETIDKVPATLRTKSGAIKHVLISSSAHFRDGKFVNTRCVTLDVTAEQSVRELAAIIESSDDAIVGMDLDGAITSWNYGAQRLYGYSTEDVLGKPISILSPPGQQHEHEEAMILDRIRAGERLQHYETVRLRQDGTAVEISLTVSPIKNESGEIIGASRIGRDVSYHKRIEDTLARRLNEQATLYRYVGRLHHADSLEEIYDAGLDTIIEALHCDRASVLLFDETGVMKFAAWRGLSKAYRQSVSSHSRWSRDTANPQPLCIDDVARADMPKRLMAAMKSENIGAIAIIPLTVGRSLIGELTVCCDDPKKFTEHEVNLCLTIARQLAFSVDRLRADRARRRAELDLHTNQERLMLATRTGKLGLWDWDIPTDTITWTDSLYTIHGVDKETFPTTVEKFASLIHPDDREFVSEAIQRSLEGGAPYELEFRAVRPDDGREIALFTSATIVKDGTKPVAMVGATMDITERKEADSQRELLLAELSHRVKNTLAVVQGIVRQTLKGTDALKDTQNALDGRLGALAKAHNLLTKTNWGSVSLQNLAADTFELEHLPKQRISFDGPHILLSPNQALAITMALHELYSNAIKYGALSNQTGRVAFRWSKTTDPDARLALEWRECGGPPVSPPRRRGFGSLMIEQALAQQFAGEITMEFPKDGIVFTMDAPLPEVGDGSL